MSSEEMAEGLPPVSRTKKKTTKKTTKKKATKKTKVEPEGFLEEGKPEAVETSVVPTDTEAQMVDLFGLGEKIRSALGIAPQIPVDLQPVMRDLIFLDCRIAQCSSIARKIAWRKKKDTAARANLLQEHKPFIKAWLKGKAKTYLTPWAKFLRKTAKKGKFVSPSKEEDIERMLRYLGKTHPKLVHEVTIYEYHWKDVEPILLEDLEKTGELPCFEGKEICEYIPSGEHLSVTTVAKEFEKVLKQEDQKWLEQQENEENAESESGIRSEEPTSRSSDDDTGATGKTGTESDADIVTDLPF